MPATVTTELGRVTEDLEQLAGLAEQLSDAETLYELIEEEADDSLRPEVEELLDDLDRRLGALELRVAVRRRATTTATRWPRSTPAPGGTDAQDWAEMMLRMYTRWAERRGFDIEVEEATPGQEAGLLSATFIVRGRYAYGLLWPPSGACTGWCASRRSTRSTGARPASPRSTWSRSSRTSRTRWRSTRRTSASTPTGRREPAASTSTRPTRRSGSPTCPTGIVVSCQNQRSQHQNKAKAMQVLGAKLAERQRAEHQATLDQLSGDRTDNAWGNQIRSYVLAPYQLVKDLRTNDETGNVDAVLDGDLDAFIEAELRRQRRDSRRNALSYGLHAPGVRSLVRRRRVGARSEPVRA